jgi:hypothetical protein
MISKIEPVPELCPVSLSARLAIESMRETSEQNLSRRVSATYSVEPRNRLPKQQKLSYLATKQTAIATSMRRAAL